MCRYQYLRYTCTCFSLQPIYTGCPPDRCLGPYIDRTPKCMNHPCAACAYRTQQDTQRRANAFDDGSNAARRKSVRQWEAGRSQSRPSGLTNLLTNAAAVGEARPGGFTNLLTNTSAVGGSDRSRSIQPQMTRNYQYRYRNRSVSPPALRHGSRSRRRDPSIEDELMRYSSEETEYTIRYNRRSGEWSSVASPRRRRHGRHGW